MDTLTEAPTIGSTTIAAVRAAVERVLSRYADEPTGTATAHFQTVFDQQNDRYLVTEVGWEDGYRIYGALLHVDLSAEGEVFIQHDGTEEGIAGDLVREGIPKESILLAFRPSGMERQWELTTA